MKARPVLALIPRLYSALALKEWTLVIGVTGNVNADGEHEGEPSSR